MKHLWIPDTQVRLGVETKHIEALGNYIIEKQFEKIIVAGDWWDMPATGKWNSALEQEGMRIEDDIVAGNDAMRLLCRATHQYNQKATNHHKKQYWPEKHFLFGNHEYHLERFVESHPEISGILGYHLLDLEQYGFKAHPFLETLELDGILYCLAPNHKILTADLRYVQLGDVKVGDEIVAFDEFSNGRIARRYKRAIVEKHDFDVADLYEVTLSNGTKFRATKEHQWLVREFGTGVHWLRTDQLRPKISKPIRLFPLWEHEQTYDTGWLAGMFDGEGHISKPNCKQGGIQVAIAQREGPTLEKIKKILADLNVTFKVTPGGGTHGNCTSVRVLGPSGEKLSLFGRIRPERLINNFCPSMLGRVQKMDNDDIVCVESIMPIGKGEIVKIQTSSATMIVDGFAHHNCHYFCNPSTGKTYGGMIETRIKNIGQSFTQGHLQEFKYGELQMPSGRRYHGCVAGAFYMHDEKYKTPQGNSHWRGVVVKNEVQDGQYDIMKISLDYLIRKYL